MFIGYANADSWMDALDRDNAQRPDDTPRQQMRTVESLGEVPYRTTRCIGVLSFIDQHGYCHYWRIRLAASEWVDPDDKKQAANRRALDGWRLVLSWLEEEGWPPETFSEAICLAPDNVRLIFGGQDFMRYDAKRETWVDSEPKPDELPDHSPFDFEGKEAAALAEHMESHDADQP